MQPRHVDATADATLSQPSQSVRETRLGFMPCMQVISTDSSSTLFLRCSRAESSVSSGLSRILDTINAEGGMTFDASEPFICVNATVVRISAFSSPPDFLQSRSSTGKKILIFANMIL